MKKLALVVVFALACSDPAPKPYAIEGTWEGTAQVGPGLLHLELAQSGVDLVGGSGVYRVGGTDYPFTLNTAVGAPAGYLRDSALFAALTASPGQASCGSSANLQAVFRRQESDGERFVAHYTCGAMTFQGSVVRK